MAELFRLVNYCNLPRYIPLYTDRTHLWMVQFHWQEVEDLIESCSKIARQLAEEVGMDGGNAKGTFGGAMRYPG